MTYSLGPRAQAAGHRLTVLDECASTNSEALNRIRAGEVGPQWIVARRQSEGRGRRGRPWLSPPGNLAASFMQELDAPPGTTATLGFAAGLALIEALGPAAGKDVDLRLKWPNDMLANGAKLAGILLEADRTPAGRPAIVVGFGVNVGAAPADVAYPATALATLGISVSAEDVFEALAESWCGALARWRGGAGMDSVRRDWLALAAGIGEPVRITRDGEQIEGTFETIDEWGRMVIAGQGGARRAISAGDVFFGRAASIR